MKRVSAAILLATMLAGLLGLAAPGLTRAEVGDSASGSGLGTNAVPREVFSFSATGGPGETATGTMHIDYYDLEGNFERSVTAVVDCLSVQGNFAVVGGTVTAATGSEVGLRLYIFATDNGPLGSQPDEYNSAFHSTYFPCSSFLRHGRPLENGDIVVVDGNPVPPADKQDCEDQSVQYGFATKRECKDAFKEQKHAE